MRHSLRGNAHLANHCNPILIAVPCHRVIGANGKLVGYGCGLDMKQALLQLEKRTLTIQKDTYQNPQNRST